MSATKPISREEFKGYILRKLGAPVIEINVSDEQIELCIEESLQWFRDFHYDGSEHVYYSHTLTQDDFDNGWIPLPQNIFGVTKMFDSANPFSFSGGVLTPGYQIMANSIMNMASGSIVSYYLNKSKYEFMRQIISGYTPIRFNKHKNHVHVDGGWNRLAVGDSVVFDAYSSIDPEVDTDVWSDRWLIRYSTAKVKQIWGQNLSKFSGLSLPGNVQFNVNYYEEATQELEKIETELLSDYSVSPRDLVG